MSKIIRNKIIDGVKHRYCPHCDSWKIADTKHFHRVNGTGLRRQCAACVNETRRALTPEKAFDDTERKNWVAILKMGAWPTKRASARSLR